MTNETFIGISIFFTTIIGVVALSVIIVKATGLLAYIINNLDNPIFGKKNEYPDVDGVNAVEVKEPQEPKEIKVAEAIDPLSYLVYKDVPSIYIKGKVFYNKYIGIACPRCDSEGREVIMEDRSITNIHFSNLNCVCPECGLRMYAHAAKEDASGRKTYLGAHIFDVVDGG